MPSSARALLDFALPPRRYRYGDDLSQRADLLLPKGPGPHPVVVTIHGGYWRAKWGRWIMRGIARDLARRGYAVWNIEYRRLGLGGGWPATFDDVAAAIDHLAHIDDGRLDLSAVTAVGHSAGGQLALFAASRQSPRVPIRRVVAQAAVCDLVSAGSVAAELLGGGPDEVPERYDATDPMRLVPLGVPVLLVHAVDDATVPIKRSRRYAEAASAAGDEVELVELEAGAHRVHVDPRSEGWRVAAEWISAGPAAPPA